MREQPIWLSLRFWNSAFFDSIQSEKDHRVLSKQKKQERRKARQNAKTELVPEPEQKAPHNENENEISTSSSSHHSLTNKIKKDRSPKTVNEAKNDVDKEMENISFRQLT